MSKSTSPRSFITRIQISDAITNSKRFYWNHFVVSVGSNCWTFSGIEIANYSAQELPHIKPTVYFIHFNGSALLITALSNFKQL